MPKGTPLRKCLKKEAFIELYKDTKSLAGMQKKTGYDPGALRDLMKEYNIPFKYKTIYSHNDNAFAIENEEVYYWAGFIAADGCIKEKNNTKIIAISLANKDLNHINKFKQFVKAEEPIKTYEKHSSIHIVSNKIALDLKYFNVVPRKTKIYTFPNIKENLIRHFMRGYFDGDGGLSINKNNQIAISVCGTKNFVTTFREYLSKHTLTNEVKVSQKQGIYLIAYCGNGNGRKILPWLYKNANIYLERKFKIAEKYFE